MIKEDELIVKRYARKKDIASCKIWSRKIISF